MTPDAVTHEDPSSMNKDHKDMHIISHKSLLYPTLSVNFELNPCAVHVLYQIIICPTLN